LTGKSLSNIGRAAAARAWNIAKQHIQKALNPPTKYYLDGPDSERIIQIKPHY
jgi:hypothetical protein